jgi:CRISPR-associated protein Cmr1
MQTKAVRRNVSFTLQITYPDDNGVKAEIAAALWAWETFGGIGARIRRGFGALQTVRVNDKPVTLPKAGEVLAMLQKGLKQHVVGDRWPAGVPHLSSELTLKVTQEFQGPQAAWMHLISRLNEFRQKRNQGSTSRQPGRSQWPEPDAIRRLTGQRSQKHSQALLNINKFPRAAFGLPIVFHFKDAGDPREITLQGHNISRLASPLILRPLLCANGAVGLAAILKGTGVGVLPGGLVLLGSNNRSWTVSALLSNAETNNIRPLGGKTDVLKAFLDTL